MSEQSAAWEYKEESPLREAWKMYLQNRAAVLGLVLLGAVLLLTCVGPLVYPVDPFEMVAPPMSAPGEYGLICGSDYLGRDIFAGIIAGARPPWRWRLRHAGDAVHRHYHGSWPDTGRASGTNCSCGPRNSFRCCLPFCLRWLWWPCSAPR